MYAAVAFRGGKRYFTTECEQVRLYILGGKSGSWYISLNLICKLGSLFH